MKPLALSKIVTTEGTQIRAKIDTDTVDQYANEMKEGSKFPPLVVFHDGSQYILADGFHRVMAASRNGMSEFPADIRKGTRTDALKYALSANVAHGLRRTNADKRRSVEMALKEWPTLSDKEIARMCSVSQPFVLHERSQHITVIGSINQPKRIGADGKWRKLPTRTKHDRNDELPAITQPILTQVEQSIPINSSEPKQELRKIQITREQLISYLESSHLESHGGYPSIIDDETIPGFVIVAGVEGSDRNEPSLSIYTEQQIQQWIKDAQELVDNGESDLGEVIISTTPQGINAVD